VSNASDDTSSEMFYLQSLVVALAVMDARHEVDDYEPVLAELTTLPGVLLAAKRDFEQEAEALAKRVADSDYHVVTGAGSSWPEAFYYGMCILEEMQWIRTRPVHASDFFHGTLELIEPGVSVLLLKSEDESRALGERVEAFAERYTDQLTVIDPAGCALPGISRRVRGLVSPVVLATLLERVSAHLEVLRDHPLTTRRYYRRVEY
jgi:fructoselysine-6-phosphate deglycase